MAAREAEAEAGLAERVAVVAPSLVLAGRVHPEAVAALALVRLRVVRARRRLLEAVVVPQALPVRAHLALLALPRVVVVLVVLAGEAPHLPSRRSL